MQSHNFPSAKLTNIPYSFARRHKIVVTKQMKASATIAVLGSTPYHAILEAQRYLEFPFTLEQVDKETFESLIQSTYEHGSGKAQQVVETLGYDLELADAVQALPRPKDLLESADEAPIIRLINALLGEAVKENASDIHIEPYEEKLAIRLRVDGILRDVLHPTLALAPLLISRIKVMAKLDIAEKRIPQDGRISLRVGGRAVDVRVSTLPASHGERAVLRLLDKQAGHHDLTKLGMSEADHEHIRQLLQRPHGIILVTGPTGSGKTTSLYAMLKQLNNRSRNILTVEDPIEYYLEGIGQTQVNTKVDMSFSRGLRAILRQDPDVVMVGEIRDPETAEISVQASLTGHLVLSTLHTNTAVGAITRLRDMGIEPFLLSSSLIGTIAQRLVRKLCESCKTPYLAENAERKMLDLPDDDYPPTLYRSVGCKKCNHQGFKGRIGIFEVVLINKEMRNMIHERASEYDLARFARIHSSGIHDNARQLVLQGKTSLAEVLRFMHDE